MAVTQHIYQRLRSENCKIVESLIQHLNTTGTKMSLRMIITLVINIVCISSIFVEIQRHFEFEDILPVEQDSFWVWRSEASNLKTLRLEDPHRVYLIEVKICINPIDANHDVKIDLDDIRYSNDGPTDSVLVTFNGEPWTDFITYEKWASGYDWNIFRNTGRIGESKYLPKGEYVIGLSVVTDEWGMEFDKIRLNAEYQNTETELFCGGRLTVVPT